MTFYTDWKKGGIQSLRVENTPQSWGHKTHTFAINLHRHVNKGIVYISPVTATVDYINQLIELRSMIFPINVKMQKTEILEKIQHPVELIQTEMQNVFFSLLL